MIRDIGLYGRGGFRSDIDLVIDWSRQDLIDALKSLRIEQVSFNRLGGIRFHYNSLDFDIWCVQDTWAFKNRMVAYEDTHSLLKTTLMSWDSVLYDVKKKRVISTENYLDDLHERRLELVLRATPNQVGSIIKILRTIYNKRVQVVGPLLCDYLLQSLQAHSYETLRQYEYRSYQMCSFNEEDLHLLRECLFHSRFGHDVRIGT